MFVSVRRIQNRSPQVVDHPALAAIAGIFDYLSTASSHTPPLPPAAATGRLRKSKMKKYAHVYLRTHD